MSRRESPSRVHRSDPVPEPATTTGIDLGDERGVRAAWGLHADELFGFACRALGDHAAADEAVQETFLRAWRAASTYDATRPLRPWLFAIMRNVIIDEARARRRRAVPHGEWDAVERLDEQAGDRNLVDRDRLDRLLDGWLLQEALRRLRNDHRIVLVETFYRDRSYASVAQDLGIPEATARTRAFYGLRALRLALEEMGWNR